MFILYERLMFNFNTRPTVRKFLRKLTRKIGREFKGK